MTGIILLFGCLVFLAGCLIVFDPDLVFAPLRRHVGELSLHVTAVGVRLVLGVLLIAHAGESKYPLAIEIIGWLSIAAAFTFAVMGRGHFRGLMSWALSAVARYGRVGGLLAVLFGGFLVYAFV